MNDYTEFLLSKYNSDIEILDISNKNIKNYKKYK